MTKESKKHYQLMMIIAQNECNKYELEIERQKKKLWKFFFDFIYDPFECEYFKVKKIEIIEKITRKSQVSGSSGHNDENFSNFNEYNGKNYKCDISLY